MKNRSIIFVLFPIMLLMAQCNVTCPATTCVDKYYPNFKFKLKDPSNHPYVTLFSYDKTSNTIGDSVVIATDTVNTFTNWVSMLWKTKREINDYYYVFKGKGLVNDTMKDISYIKKVYQVACGKCSDGKDEYVNITHYQNFTYTCNGKVFKDIDTLKIGF